MERGQGFSEFFRASRVYARQRRARRGDIDLQRKIRDGRFDFGRSGIFPVGGRATIETRHVQSCPRRDIIFRKFRAALSPWREALWPCDAPWHRCQPEHYFTKAARAWARTPNACAKYQRSLLAFVGESLPFLAGKNPCGRCNPRFKKLKKKLAKCLRTQ